MRLSIIERLGLVALTLLTGFSLFPTFSESAKAAPVCNGRIIAIGIDKAQAFKITPGFLGNRWKSDNFKIATTVAMQVADDAPMSLETYTTPETKFSNHQVRDPWYLNASGYYCLGNSMTAMFTVTAWEDDDISLPRLDHLLTSIAAALGAIITDQPELGAVAAAQAKNAAVDIVNAFKQSPDDLLGAFVVKVTNHDGNLSFEWQPLHHTTMMRYNNPDSPRYAIINDDSGATFDMTGDGSFYRLNASVWGPQEWPE